MRPSISESLLEAAIQSADYGCVILDSHRRICLWNKWMAKISEISQDHAVGRTLAAVLGLSDDSICQKAIIQALDHGKSTLLSQTFHPHPLPLYRKTAKKSLMTQRIVIRSQSVDGQRFCIIEINDQSSGSEREKFLAHARDYVAKVIDAIQDSMIILDLDYRICEVNAITTSSWRYSATEIVGRHLSEFLVSPKKLELWSRTQKVDRKTSIKDIELTIATRYKGHRTFILSGSFIDRDEPSNLLFAGIAKDITDMRANEQLLVEQKAQLASTAKLSALGEMAGSIAHEINNPLAIIHGLAFQLKKRLHKSELDKSHSAFELITEIEATTKRISKIIKGLKVIARTGDYDDFLPACIKTIIDDTLGLCSENFKTQGIELTVSLPAEIPAIECRQVQIAQVLLNLFNNSKDAILELKERWVKVDVQHDAERLWLIVSDSGSGIDQDKIEKIFLPFFTTKSIGKGTGLGLSISKGIIEDHGGEFFIDALKPNTTFVIVLPIKQQKRQTA